MKKSSYTTQSRTAAEDWMYDSKNQDAEGYVLMRAWKGFMLTAIHLDTASRARESIRNYHMNSRKYKYKCLPEDGNAKILLGKARIISLILNSLLGSGRLVVDDPTRGIYASGVKKTYTSHARMRLLPRKPETDREKPKAKPKKKTR